MSDNQDGSGALKAEVSREPLRTREVFLDTEAFRRLGFDTAKPSIQALLGHIAEDRLQLHLADITAKEIERQIAAAAQQAMEEIRRASATIEKWRKRAPQALGPAKKPPKPIDADAVARESFGQFLRSIAPYVLHHATRQNAEGIFRAYFNREPPFDGEDGKSVKEFPDAFVITALEQWCVENEAHIYVVTNDRAMLRAATARERLIPVETLESLLQIVTVEHAPDVIETVDTILDQAAFVDQLESAIDRVIDQLEVTYAGDLYDGEASDPVRVGAPTVTERTVISAFEKGFGVIVEIDIDVLVQVNYEDISMASYDKEDGVYFGAEHATENVEEQVSLRMFIQLHENCSITRAELLTSEAWIYGSHDYYK